MVLTGRSIFILRIFWLRQIISYKQTGRTEGTVLRGLCRMPRNVTRFVMEADSALLPHPFKSYGMLEAESGLPFPARQCRHVPLPRAS